MNEMLSSLSSSTASCILSKGNLFSVVFLVILAVITSLPHQPHQSQLNSSRECKALKDQKIDEIDLRIAYKAGVLSAIAYLQYEINSYEHPWSLSFDTKKQQHVFPHLYSPIVMVKALLTQRLCQLKALFLKSITYCERTLRKIPTTVDNLFLRLFRKKREDYNNHNTRPTYYPTHESCLISEGCQESFSLKWFFSNFKEGIWHDTDVLLGESKTTVVVTFRGSNSLADICTNSQTMKPANHSVYFGVQEGSIHRGMLNAYARVDTGKLFKLDRKDKSGSSHDKKRKFMFDQDIADTYDAFLRIQMLTANSNSTITNRIYSTRYDTRNNANHHNEKNLNEHDVNDNVLNFVNINRLLLSDLLTSAVLSALKSGKRVIVTGHSLGGSLALLLALDAIINSDKKTLIKFPRNTDEGQMSSSPNIGNSLIEKNRNKKLQLKKPLNSNSRNISRPLKKDNNVNKNFKEEQKVKNIKRDNYNVKFFNELYVVTFGQPDLADEMFFHSVSQNKEVKRLLTHRYIRVVSLSNAPSCDHDIITKLVDRVGKVLGHRLAAGRKKQKIKKTIKVEEGSVNYSKTNDSTNSKGATNRSIGIITDSKNVIGNSNIIPKRTTVISVNSKNKIPTSKLNKNSKKKKKIISEKKRNRSVNSSSQTSAVPIFDTSHETGRKLFVSSGRSKDNIQAHHMSQYLRGIQIMAEKYNRKKQTSDLSSNSEKKEAFNLFRIFGRFTIINMFNVFVRDKKIVYFPSSSNNDNSNNSNSKIVKPKNGINYYGVSGINNNNDSRSMDSTVFDTIINSGAKHSTDTCVSVGKKTNKAFCIFDYCYNNATNSKSSYNIRDNYNDQHTVKNCKSNSRKSRKKSEGLYLSTNLRKDSALQLNLISEQTYNTCLSHDNYHSKSNYEYFTFT